MTSFSNRCPAVKRLMKEALELSEATEQYYAQPLEDNLFEWHFTIRGPDETDFAGGFYHGRIILPPEYPMKPPNIILLTPNGRFETFKKICLSISGHHPESWQPSWSIRTALLAIIGFMPTHGNGAIGSLDYTPEERKGLAKLSNEWKCDICGLIKYLLSDEIETPSDATEEMKRLASQICFHGEPVSKNEQVPEEKENQNRQISKGHESSMKSAFNYSKNGSLEFVQELETGATAVSTENETSGIASNNHNDGDGTVDASQSFSGELAESLSSMNKLRRRQGTNLEAQTNGSATKTVPCSSTRQHPTLTRTQNVVLPSTISGGSQMTLVAIICISFVLTLLVIRRIILCIY